LKALVLIIFALVFSFIHLNAQTDTIQKEEFVFYTIEELMHLKVYTASKTSEKLSDVPSTMSVITSADIEQYGYSTLYEALAHIPEVYTHYDGHNYSCDFRGFFTNNTERRVLYLLDGHKLNDRFHFGDFYPDMIVSLENISRIEIIRGPGASLYGNNSVLGVVNIISKKPEENLTTNFSITTNIISGYGANIYTFSHRSVYNKLKLSFDFDWYDYSFDYDAKTNWYNAEADNGIYNLHYTTDVFFNTDKSTLTGAFEHGKKIPNSNIKVSYGDFQFGTHLFSRKASWVWPKDNSTFGYPTTDRAWGTSSIYMTYLPISNKLAELDFMFTISRNYNTNREIADFDANKSILRLQNAAFANAFSNETIINRDQAVFLKDESGEFYEYVSTKVDSNNLMPETIAAHGRGSQFVYHGVDKVNSMDLQIAPVKNEKIKILFGANANFAKYVNYQRYTYRDNVFIGWARWGGISAEGYSIGAFSQLKYTPILKLSLTVGLRYDNQMVKEVYRQLGGEVRYTAVEWDENGSPIAYQPVIAEKRLAQDITPRLSLNYKITKNTNVRIFYGQAFRAVPSQEINRLPLDAGDAKSEKTDSYEFIISSLLNSKLNITLNGFWLIGSEIYQWNPVSASFSKGTGWNNKGFSTALQFRPSTKFDFWANSTLYSLERPTDPYKFMLDDDGNPLKNEFRPLDSPTLLLKGGSSCKISKTYTSIAVEIIHNGEIKALHPKRENTEELYYEHEIPSSTLTKLTVVQSFKKMEVLKLRLQINNLFNTNIWYILPSEAEESWSTEYYEKPHQLPGFGRYFQFSASYSF